MSNIFKRYVQQFLSFPRSDRNAIIILSTIVIVLIIAIVIQRNIEAVPKSDFSEIKAILEDWKKAEEKTEHKSNLVLFDFNPNTISEEKIDSLDLPGFVKRNLINYRNAGGKFKSGADVRKIYGMNDSIFSLIENHIQIKTKKEPTIVPKVKLKLSGNFDPNKASASTLKQFGFSNYQANNLISYRGKGGAFKIPSDVLKIYGIDSAFYNSISEYISIEQLEVLPHSEIIEEIMVELNVADSADLIQLNGIGPTYANRIIKYRDLLGGYHSKDQLKEIYNFPEETYAKIHTQVYVDTLKIVKLRINFAEFPELLRHPYLNKAQVKALLAKREADGPFKDITELQVLKSFDSEIIGKISAYITCR